MQNQDQEDFEDSEIEGIDSDGDVFRPNDDSVCEKEQKTPQELIQQLIELGKQRENEIFESKRKGVTNKLDIPLSQYIQALHNPKKEGEFILVKLSPKEPDYLNQLMLKGHRFEKNLVEKEQKRETMTTAFAIIEFWEYDSYYRIARYKKHLTIPNPHLFEVPQPYKRRREKDSVYGYDQFNGAFIRRSV